VALRATPSKGREAAEGRLSTKKFTILMSIFILFVFKTYMSRKMKGIKYEH